MCSYIYSKRSGLKRCYADVIVEEMHNHGHSDLIFRMIVMVYVFFIVQI